MPIYEYRCKKCNTEFELLLYSGETAICPKCNSKDLIKKISLCSFSSGGSSNDSFSSENSSSSNSCGSCSSKSCATCK